MAIKAFRAEILPDARCGAARVEDRLSPAREERLHMIAFGHRPIAFGEHLPDVFEGRRIFDQINVRHLSEHFAGQVVLRWAESTGGDDEVGTLDGDSKAIDVVGQIIGDGGVKTNRRTPISANLRLSHWQLVSRFWPLVSSLPIERISAFMELVIRSSQLWPLAGKMRVIF